MWSQRSGRRGCRMSFMASSTTPPRRLARLRVGSAGGTRVSVAAGALTVQEQGRAPAVLRSSHRECAWRESTSPGPRDHRAGDSPRRRRVVQPPPSPQHQRLGLAVVLLRRVAAAHGGFVGVGRRRQVGQEGFRHPGAEQRVACKYSADQVASGPRHSDACE